VVLAQIKVAKVLADQVIAQYESFTSVNNCYVLLLQSYPNIQAFICYMAIIRKYASPNVVHGTAVLV
jgi:hypothetical protein